MADLAVATLILDRDGRILRRNAMAERLMRQAGALTERGGRLESVSRAGAAALARLLAAPPAPGEERLIEFSGAAGPALHARARAVPSSAYGDGAWIALFLADSARPASPSGDLLRERFQLTPAEAALALHLAQGATLADAADRLDIAYNTARSHLRAIFAKTRTHRQVDLVTLLHAAASLRDI
jgi:DNA-binding CsgD family transcriptional regulator